MKLRVKRASSKQTTEPPSKPPAASSKQTTGASSADAPVTSVKLPTQAMKVKMEAVEQGTHQHSLKKSADGKQTISVAFERGNRMAIRWPVDATGITQSLTYNEEFEPNTIFGRIEELADGTKKKVIPLNFDYAARVMNVLRIYDRQRDHLNRPMYHIDIPVEWVLWYEQEQKAFKQLADAHNILKYEEGQVQTSFDFLKRDLYPWQTVGYQFIDAITAQGRGAFLCDETGLGKTYITGAHLKSIGAKAVVICPAGLLFSWKKKIEDLTDLTTFIIGSKYPMNAAKYDVIIISYSMLKKHGMWPLSDIIEGQNRVLIMDEGHMAKSYDSNRTGLCVALSNFARHTVVVTATPLKNRVGELHPLLRMTRRLWTSASYEAFVKMYSTPERQDELATKLKGFMVRRLKHEVWADAPDVEVNHAWLPLTNRDDYDEAEHDFIQWLMRNGADIERLESAERGRALVKLNKLRELSAVGKMASAAKIIERTMSHNEQVVVFCAFNEPLMHLAKAFAGKSGKNYRGDAWAGSGLIIGSTPLPVRETLIQRFNDGKLGLLCIGVNSGGHGIDLPIARFGYFLDLPWSPADFEQCTGRLNRIGQERDCQFIKLLAENTIDQRMEQIIQMKAEIFKHAIGDAGAVDRVTGRDPSNMSMVRVLLQSYLREMVENSN